MHGIIWTDVTGYTMRRVTLNKHKGHRDMINLDLLQDIYIDIDFTTMLELQQSFADYDDMPSLLQVQGY